MSRKAEEDSGLAPADDDNAAGRKLDRKDIYVFIEISINMPEIVLLNIEI
ncbi:MAG: hypothetical protein PHV07_05695 [Oscillospiraceae bacterium]|nr:hypothetical protein [Oscillospiraceae bacterium]